MAKDSRRDFFTRGCNENADECSNKWQNLKSESKEKLERRKTGGTVNSRLL
ncbi:hypothetical protein DPMN_103412 [Dreissena polymorpha]|uniref:Uncharacterized protein n=1 Tax=Dreissena polymorpha TaxID=45954 RepID=A0A9D4HA00_DREPO|nr:hypothetical protein DPMN_103412 [Dreissena polymorpha]